MPRTKCQDGNGEGRRHRAVIYEAGQAAPRRRAPLTALPTLNLPLDLLEELIEECDKNPAIADTNRVAVGRAKRCTVSLHLTVGLGSRSLGGECLSDPWL